MSQNITRRRVLRNTVAGAVATGIASTAAAKKPERKIVGLTPDVGFDVAERQANDVRHELDFGDLGKVVAGQFSERAVKSLEKNPNVRYVEDDRTVWSLAQESSWGINSINADILRDYGETGYGGHVAILDSGIDADHPDLQANIGTGEDFTGIGSWDDDNGHGTHCAGVVAAADNDTGIIGVAPEATLHAVKVLDYEGKGYTSDVAAGIEWTTDQGYHVGSLSLGVPGSSALSDAVQYATNRGVLLVAAAGNTYGGSVEYPAAYSEVMAVSSVNRYRDISSFSATGPEVEICAPGEDINSTYIGGGTEEDSGTSMACPHVSGVAAHLMADGHSNSSARSRLKNTAEDLGLSSYEQGAGRVDARAAVGADASEVGPQLDSFSPYKSETNDGDYIHVSWMVQDLNGNLDEVETTVAGSTIRTPVSGDKQGSTDTHGPFNHPYSYGVYITVTDEASNEVSDSTTVY